VISDRDLLGRQGEVASDLMTPNPLTVQREALLDPAVTMLIQKRISCLPVTHEGRLCGLLTTTDVMMALQCISQVMQRLSDEEHSQGHELNHAQLTALEHDIEGDLAAVVGAN
jgi:signal-transduction protein with cAMP-binding, CBS, and nucleotidyltransferase domain